MLSAIGYCSRKSSLFITSMRRPTLGPSQHILWVQGALSLRVNGLKRVFDKSVPSSSELYFLPLIRFQNVMLFVACPLPPEI
jgi:hypothetical protein